MALTLLVKPVEGLPITNLPKLRTEIVLKDENHVVFWFSFSFKVAMLRQQKTGKDDRKSTHQTQISPKALFPKRRRV